MLCSGKSYCKRLVSPPPLSTQISAHTPRKLPMEIWHHTNLGISFHQLSYLISQQISGNSLKIVLPNRFISCAKKVIAVVVVVVVVGVGSKFHRWE